MVVKCHWFCPLQENIPIPHEKYLFYYVTYMLILINIININNSNPLFLYVGAINILLYKS